MIDYENPAEIIALVNATFEELQPMHRAADAVVSSIYDDAYGAGAAPWVSSVTPRGDEQSLSWPENVHYEYVQHTAAHLGFRLPRSTVKSHRGNRQKATATGLGRGLDRWTREKQVARTLNRLLEDMLHGYATAIVLHKSNDVLHPDKKVRAPGLPRKRTEVQDGQILADRNPTDEINAQMPQLVRLNRKNVIFDTLAEQREESMFMGHRMVLDRSRLRRIAQDMKADGYDLDAIDRLQKVDLQDDRRGKSGVLGLRDLVGVWELWFPAWRLAEADEFEQRREVKTHGTLVTVAEGASGGVVVREARPYYGWREGPYIIGGMIDHPEYSVPTSPCVMSHPAAVELNAIASACVNGARNYKRLMLVDSAAQDVAKKLRVAPHDFIVEVPGLLQEGKPAVIVVELGGVTDQMLLARAAQMERYERVSGLSETRRGRAQSGATATGDLIADQGADKRLVRLERPWDAFVEDIYRRAAFFMYDSRDIVFSFGPEESAQVARELGLDQPSSMPAEVRAEIGAEDDAPAWVEGEELYFRGGRGSEGSFDDLDISVDVSSQRKPDDPAQAAAVAGFVAELMQLLPAMGQVPEGIDWASVLADLAESKGVPHMARYVDVAALLGRPELREMQVDMATTVGAGTSRPAITLAQRPAGQPQQRTAAAGQAAGQPQRAPAAPGAMMQ